MVVSCNVEVSRNISVTLLKCARLEKSFGVKSVTDICLKFYLRFTNSVGFKYWSRRFLNKENIGNHKNEKQCKQS